MLQYSVIRLISISLFGPKGVQLAYDLFEPSSSSPVSGLLLEPMVFQRAVDPGGLLDLFDFPFQLGNSLACVRRVIEHYAAPLDLLRISMVMSA